MDRSEALRIWWTYYDKVKWIDSGVIPKLRMKCDALENRLIKETQETKQQRKVE